MIDFSSKGGFYMSLFTGSKGLTTPPKSVVFVDNDFTGMTGMYPCIPSGICYAMVYPPEESRSDPEGDELWLLRVKGNKEAEWKIYKDQLKDVVGDMIEAFGDRFRCDSVPWEGTKSRVRYIDIFIDDQKLVSYSSIHLILFNRNIEKAIETFDKTQLHRYHQMMDNLFP